MFTSKSRALNNILNHVKRTIDSHYRRVSLQINRINQSINNLWICMFCTWGAIIMLFIVMAVAIAS